MNPNSRKQSEAYRGRSDPSHPATPASRRRDAEGNAVACWPNNDRIGRWFRKMPIALSVNVVNAL
jgi:hypothetical protein